MGPTVVCLPVNMLTILQEESLSPLNRLVNVGLYSNSFVQFFPWKITPVSHSVVPHASLQEVNDLGNPQSEAAIEECSEDMLTNNGNNWAKEVNFYGLKCNPVSHS